MHWYKVIRALLTAMCMVLVLLIDSSSEFCSFKAGIANAKLNIKTKIPSIDTNVCPHEDPIIPELRRNIQDWLKYQLTGNFLRSSSLSLCIRFFSNSEDPTNLAFSGSGKACKNSGSLIIISAGKEYSHKFK